VASSTEEADVIRTWD